MPSQGPVNGAIAHEKMILHHSVVFACVFVLLPQNPTTTTAGTSY